MFISCAYASNDYKGHAGSVALRPSQLYVQAITRSSLSTKNIRLAGRASDNPCCAKRHTIYARNTSVVRVGCATLVSNIEIRAVFDLFDSPKTAFAGPCVKDPDLAFTGTVRMQTLGQTEISICPKNAAANEGRPRTLAHVLPVNHVLIERQLLGCRL